MKKSEVEVLANVSNGGADEIAYGEPYQVDVTIEGVAPILFHAWNCEEIEEKKNAPKNSKAKKTDNIPSYVYRDDKGHICLLGEALRQAIIHASKFKQDPRSPRKSAADLFKAGIVCLTPLASFGVKDWSHIDRRRAMVQRQGITRSRPALREGWKVTVQFAVLLPEYIDRHLFAAVLSEAGRLVGVGDNRPTYGRFTVASFK